MKKNCIIILSHIGDKFQANILKRCVDSIRTYAKDVPIVLCSSGNTKLIKKKNKLVDHHITTSINTLSKTEDSLEVFYATANWHILYKVPGPRFYWGFAHMQKLGLALHGAMSLGYENFLVVNYDTILEDAGFVEYMLSQNSSVFFNFDAITYSADVCKLDKNAAEIFMNISTNEQLFKQVESLYKGQMFENTLYEIVKKYNITKREFPAVPRGLYQIHPFRVILNASHNGGAMAVVKNGKIHLLVTDSGHPRYTVDNLIEIGYNEVFTKVDLSIPVSMLLPITEYEGKDIEVIVRTSFGEEKVKILKSHLENTRYGVGSVPK